MTTIVTESLKLLRAATAAVPDAKKDAPTPCSEWTVTQVLQHAAGDQLAWAAALGTGTGPTYNPFEPSGLDTDLDALVAFAIATATTAWATVDEGDSAVATPLPQGALPVETAAAACALDAAVHAWDVSVAVGLPSPIDDDLASRLLPAAHEIVELLRQYGAYGPPLEPDAGDRATEELLRYLGRDPGWRP
jgi:uncharacterized protein (TIGR03086 family)